MYIINNSQFFPLSFRAINPQHIPTLEELKGVSKYRGILYVKVNKQKSDIVDKLGKLVSNL